jgi:hypothetical protein
MPICLVLIVGGSLTLAFVAVCYGVSQHSDSRFKDTIIEMLNDRINGLKTALSDERKRNYEGAQAVRRAARPFMDAIRDMGLPPRPTEKL